ncbi:MAG: glycosyltransferase [Actinomycetota bacterium]
MSDLKPSAPRARIAAISLHTSPLDQPGTGDSGGMNVYVRSVTERLADQGVAVDVFTRCAGRGVPEVEPIGSLTRVIQVGAGPCAPVAKGDLPRLLPRFEAGVLARAEAEGPYDLVHANYWLSGRVGLAAAARWDVPLVASFHTLGEVKNRALGGDGVPEPGLRLEGERRAIRGADRILAPTPAEVVHLVDLYGAAPERIRIVAPGVDATAFSARPKDQARRRLGLDARTVVLFLGRLQPVKGPDVAIRTVAEAFRRDPALMHGTFLVVVGGPSGDGGDSYAEGLRRLAERQGISDRVVFLDPRPHQELPWVYSAADVLLMPSRSESFGLAALEAQACSVPVVAASVGGLRYIVEDGASGFLVDGHDPAAHADRLLRILGDPDLATSLARGARARAFGFAWDETADGVLGAYAELLPELAPASVA